jgi:hypothetical protein
MAYEIQLGPPERLRVLYSYPNNPNEPNAQTLGQTIEHWFGLTLQRDGLKAGGATATVQGGGGYYTLVLDGPPQVAKYFPVYGRRLPQFLENGWNAFIEDVTRIRAGKAVKPWDPTDNGWRFFLPHGAAMARQRSLQFFHYPPIRLLWLQDYLCDPVPHRCEDLLLANGVKTRDEAQLYETIMDATPIGADDDQGQLGTIPIDEFYVYQAAQTRLLLNVSDGQPQYTIPIVVYGDQPKRVFSKLFLDGKPLQNNQVATAQIIPGKKTPVIGAKHPYAFYGQIQGGKVGSGTVVPENCAAGAAQMVQDLIVARWQVLMAQDPSQDAEKVLSACTQYWQHPDQKHAVCALVRYQGSLFYPDPSNPDPRARYGFTFKVDQAKAGEICAKSGDDPCTSPRAKAPVGRRQPSSARKGTDA